VVEEVVVVGRGRSREKGGSLFFSGWRIVDAPAIAIAAAELVSLALMVWPRRTDSQSGFTHSWAPFTLTVRIVPLTILLDFAYWSL